MLVNDILNSRTSSQWLLTALTQALARDPLDALDDAGLLFEALKGWTDAKLAETETDMKIRHTHVS